MAEQENSEAESQHEHYIGRLPIRTAVYFSIASLGIGMIFAFFNAALPLYLNSYNLPSGLIGILANERSFASAIVLPLIGAWSDRTRTRYGKRRPFMIVAGPLVALSLLVLGFHPPLPIMLVVVLLAAAFVFLAMAPYQAMMADISPPDQRSELGSYMALAGMIGAVAANVIAGLFWETNEFLVFALNALGLLLALAVTFYFVHEPAHHFTPLPPRQLGVPRRIQPIIYARDVLSFRQTMLYVVVLCFYWLAAGGATPFLTLFATKSLGVGESDAFWLFLVVVISTAIGTIPAGRLAKRYGNRPLLQVGLGIFTLAALGGLLVQDIWQALPVMVLVGLGNACPTALSLALLADLMPRKRGGEFIGIASAAWSIAQPVGGFIAGSLIEANGGNIRWAFGFAAIMMAISLFGLFAVKVDQEPPERAIFRGDSPAS